MPCGWGSLASGLCISVLPQGRASLASGLCITVLPQGRASLASGEGQRQTDPAYTQAHGGAPEPEAEPDPLQDQSMGLVQRFKRTLKQYGKVLVPVHLVTSSLWVGTFYYAAMKGVNIVPFIEAVGFPQRLIDLLQNSQGGYALTTYAMYKMATPARYTVTLGGTSLCVKYLRRHGYMSTPPPVKDYLQGRMVETRERLSEKMEETKDRLTGRLQETKDKVSFRKKPE
ncbi:uncharacterized protein C18orf19 homolog A [Aplochiton taeniatus]